MKLGIGIGLDKALSANGAVGGGLGLSALHLLATGGSRAEVNSADSLGHDFSVSMWIIKPSIGNNVSLSFRNESDTSFSLQWSSSSESLTFNTWDTSLTNRVGRETTFSSPGSSELFHVVLTQSSFLQDDTKVYINGADASTSGVGYAPTKPQSEKYTFGSRGGTGYLSEIKVLFAGIYNTAISAANVESLYNSGTPASPLSLLPSGLIHCWDFTEGSGASVEDSVGTADLSLIGDYSWVEI